MARLTPVLGILPLVTAVILFAPYFRRPRFPMLYGGHIKPFRPLIPIALSVAVWACCAPSPAEAATCGHYLHTAKDSAREYGEVESVTVMPSQKAPSTPVAPCKGPRCGKGPGVPATPQPLVRSARLHEPLLSISADFELKNLVDFRRLVITFEPTDGYPCRINRPPRRERGLLS